MVGWVYIINSLSIEQLLSSMSAYLYLYLCMNYVLYVNMFVNILMHIYISNGNASYV